MKTRLSLVFIAALAACSPSFAAENEKANDTVVAYSDTQNDLFTPLIGRGTPAASVRESIGDPSLCVTPDVWVYWNYRTSDSAVNRAGFDTLVVTFAHGRVTGFRIVKRASVDALVARLDSTRPAGRAVAAK